MWRWVLDRSEDFKVAAITLVTGRHGHGGALATQT